MIEVARTELTVVSGIRMPLVVDDEWSIFVNKTRSKTASPVAGLALAVLMDYKDEVVPKQDLLPLAFERLEVEDPFQSGPFAGIKNKDSAGKVLVARLNHFRRLHSRTVGENVIAVGSGAEAHWILVDNVVNEQHVIDLICQQVPLSDKEARLLLGKKTESISGKPPDKPPDRPLTKPIGGRKSPQDPPTLRVVESADRQEMYNFINSMEPGTSVLRSELDDWVFRNGLTGMPVDKIVEIARGQGLIEKIAIESKRPGLPANVRYTRL